MKDVDKETKRLARSSLIWYALGLACGIVLAVFLVGNTIRMIAYPSRGDRVGGCHRGGKPSTRSCRSPVRRRIRATGLGVQYHGAAASGVPPIAQGPIDPRRADKPGDDRLSSQAGPGRRSGPKRRKWPTRLRAASSVCQSGRRNSLPAIWEPPEALRQPLADALREQLAYIPEGFDKVIVLDQGEQPNSELAAGSADSRRLVSDVGAAILLENVTRFRLLDEVKSNMVATVSHELKTPADQHPPRAPSAPSRKPDRCRRNSSNCS